MFNNGRIWKAFTNLLCVLHDTYSILFYVDFCVSSTFCFQGDVDLVS